MASDTTLPPPNPAKPRAKRRNYAPLDVPALPSIPADAAAYRASSSSLPPSTPLSQTFPPLLPHPQLRIARDWTPLAVPVIPPPPPGADSYRPDSPLPAPNPPPSKTISDFPHTQPRLRAPMQTSAEKLADKFDAMDKLLESWPFDTLGDFLQILFHNPTRSESDPRTDRHALTVAQFLRGRTDIKMSNVFPLIYHHRSSYPSSRTVRAVAVIYRLMALAVARPPL
ncbi:hypothetical protein DFH06DRAFT_1337080 [Mycena polygramma]|nr:hypothetical protein DFH06DRAFT_1337080 [Mycena polygramma]